MSRAKGYKNLTKLFDYENKKVDIYKDLKAALLDIVNGPAYKDFTPRTIRNILNIKTKIENAREKLAEDIYNFLKNKKYTKNSFESFHKNACDNFLKNINNGTNNFIAYGKAQKILNMTFKYLYMLDEKQKYKEVYKFCHMPIDSYILRWFKNNISKVVIANGKKIKISDISWSNLDVVQYYSIQNEIEKYFKSENNTLYFGLNRFEAEFYIWREQQIGESILVLAPKKDYKSYEWDLFDDNEINKELNEVVKHLENIINNKNFKQIIKK